MDAFDNQKMIIGSVEWCGLADLNIPAIKARVDSGAKTSAIHAFNIEEFKRGEAFWVRFELHPLQKNITTTVECEAEVIDRRLVKNSGGVAEERYVIKTPVSLGGKTWDIELTLTNRDSMGYRMLLGREAMGGRVLVDPGESLMLGKRSGAEIRKSYNIVRPEKAAR
ncbi:MAG: ATP-dependent zinc protease [Pseudomonadales bacterium]|nr:ATP-dependent zinc protease [Pseudomonadales bacterium]